MKKKSKYKQNENFIPENKSKYKGTYPIYLRSGWEIKFAKWCDEKPYVLEWTSESAYINYYNVTKRRMARYFPDFSLKVKTKSGEIKHWLVEVKPAVQTKPPERRGKKKTTQMYEAATWIENQCKWKAAREWCKCRNIEFKIITEYEIFNKKRK